MGRSDYITVDDSDDDCDDISRGDDFPSMFVKLLTAVNFKIAIFIFIIGMIVFSDVFVLNVLTSFNDATTNLQMPSTYGTMIQLSFLVLGYIAIDLLVQGKYI